MTKADPIDHDKIKADLKTKFIGQKILVYRSTSSTNDIAAEYAKNKENNGLVIFAETQTSGRGRSANIWLSEPAQSILCSTVLTQSKLNPEILSLTVAVAVAETIGKLGKVIAKIKWPNDIMIDRKKIAGILLESTTTADRTNYTIGIGINCHQKIDSFPPDLRQKATSIDLETNTTSDRNLLAKRLLTSLEHWLEIAETKEKKVIDQWQKLSTLLGQRITVLYNAKKFTGYCTGIDPKKGLILQLDSNTTSFFHATQTSIIK